MKYKTVLFDLDGTLTDSGEGIMSSGRYALIQLGIAVPGEQELRTMVGPPLSVSFTRFGVPAEQVDEAIRLYRDQYNNRGGKYKNRVYPGIEEMLKELQDIGCRLFVATSKPEALAREILERFQLASFFEYIAGATLDHSRESKSDVLKYLLAMTGTAEDTVMIGDTSFDVTGAKEQGLPCVGVSWGYGLSEEMQQAGAVRIVDSPAELSAFLKES